MFPISKKVRSSELCSVLLIQCVESTPLQLYTGSYIHVYLVISIWISISIDTVNFISLYFKADVICLIGWIHIELKGICLVNTHR